MNDNAEGFSTSAVEVLRAAIRRGQGTMAQFNHPDLGGAGQWMRGGMTMVGTMDVMLADRVSRLAEYLAGQPNAPTDADDADTTAWWPRHLGEPSAAGSQGDSLYAYFPEHQRLAIRDGDRTTLYDTTGHFLSGVSQQSPGTGLRFSTLAGLVGTDRFLIVDKQAAQPERRSYGYPDDV